MVMGRIRGAKNQLILIRAPVSAVVAMAFLSCFRLRLRLRFRSAVLVLSLNLSNFFSLNFAGESPSEGEGVAKSF